MSETPASTILLVTADDDRRQRWSAVLDDGRTVCRSVAELSGEDDRQQDVVVIVTDVGAPNLGTVEPLPQFVAQQQRLGHVGVVAIGAGPGDVVLPEDATDRELRLACRLLADIVRLRRRGSRFERQRRMLSELARTDSLTGLSNRRAWDEQLRQWSDDAQRHPLWCVALVDLDHFKRVNDALGHAAGDDVLRRTAEGLRANVRDDDFVARLGGDEFALRLGGLGRDSVAEVCERIRVALVAHLATTGPPPVTASLGYCIASVGAETSADAVTQAADAALHRAKLGGRDRSEGGDVE